MKTYEFRNCKTGDIFNVVANSWAKAENKANQVLNNVFCGHRYYWMHCARLIK